MSLATDREKCAHLLRRFGFGATEEDLTLFLKGGLPGAIDRLLNYEQVEDTFDLDVRRLPNENDNKIHTPAIIAWWVTKMIVTKRPLEEKMALFWHDHFATSADKVKTPTMMLAQNMTLRRNATGSFRTLLGEMSKDPAMVFWLDNQENVAGHPNENFAREVMELFTLGIGHYTEKDVTEAARAFTGWSYERVTSEPTPTKPQYAFAFNEDKHDTGAKTFLGRTGNWGGDDILDILCQEFQAAKYITYKIWEWFVYPSPRDEVVTRFAKIFADSGLKIKVLLGAIMNSPEFYSDEAVRSIVKNPADFVIPPLRQIGVDRLLLSRLNAIPAEAYARRAIQPSLAAVQAMWTMGMYPLWPPDVSGWIYGQAWITSATMVERMTLAKRLFGAPGPNDKGRNLFFNLDAYPLLKQARSAEDVVDILLRTFDVPLSPNRRDLIVKAARKSGADNVTPRSADDVMIGTLQLLFASPEFQFI